MWVSGARAHNLCLSSRSCVLQWAAVSERPAPLIFLNIYFPPTTFSGRQI
uniref:Uncharacterized protein n=1 Tax=Anguilla anguilla TaxID=7936 RepID=A0A0E9U1L8_ANGAN